MEKKLDVNYTRMQLYSYIPPIMKTIKIRQARHAGHCWRSRDELVCDVLLWTPSCRQSKAGCPVQTYISQLCANMGCCPQDLSKAMDDREVWRETVRNFMLRAQHDDDDEMYLKLVWQKCNFKKLLSISSQSYFFTQILSHWHVLT